MSALPDHKKLPAARALLGWPQKVLADRMGLSPNTIWRLEQGDYSARIKYMRPAIAILAAQGIEFHPRGVTLGEAA